MTSQTSRTVTLVVARTRSKSYEKLWKCRYYRQSALSALVSTLRKALFSMALLGQARHCVREQLQTGQTQHSSESSVANLCKNTWARVLEWCGNSLKWQGRRRLASYSSTKLMLLEVRASTMALVEIMKCKEPCWNSLLSWMVSTQEETLR